ncbi:MAG: chemotaxis protein CheW [Firmicutes bacterium]|nr:chemotaxis protein CheW [Bacillota bacterium]
MNVSQTGVYGQELQLVAFILGTEEYAADILLVQEINRLLKITRVPKAPEFIEGVINLRGNVIPVFDLHKRLDLGKRKDTDRTRIIIVQVNDIRAGLIVDGVTEVLRLKADQVELPSTLDSTVALDFIAGVGKLNDRLLMLLKIDKVLGLEAVN